MDKKKILILGSILVVALVLIAFLIYGCSQTSTSSTDTGSSTGVSVASNFQDSLRSYVSNIMGAGSSSSSADQVSTNASTSNTASGGSQIVTSSAMRAMAPAHLLGIPWPFIMFADNMLTDGTYTWQADFDNNQTWTSTIDITPDTPNASAPFFDQLSETTTNAAGDMQFQQTIVYNLGDNGVVNWPPSWSASAASIDTTTNDDYIAVSFTDHASPSPETHTFKAYLDGTEVFTHSNPDGSITTGTFNKDTGTFTDVTTWPASGPMAGSRRESSGTFDETTRTGTGTYKFWMRGLAASQPPVIVSILRGSSVQTVLLFYEEGTWSFAEPSSPDQEPAHSEQGTRTFYDDQGTETMQESFEFTGDGSGRNTFILNTNAGTPNDISDDMRVVGTDEVAEAGGVKTMTHTEKGYLSYGTTDLSDDYLINAMTVTGSLSAADMMIGPMFPPPAGFSMTITMYPQPNIDPSEPADSPLRHVVQIQQNFQDEDSSGVIATGTINDLGTDGTATPTLIANLVLEANGDQTLSFPDGTSVTFNIFGGGAPGAKP